MSSWTTQVIINGDYEFVEDLTMEQIRELQKLLKKFKNSKGDKDE